MDEGLFKKHLQTLSKRNDQKQAVISLIQTRTGITLEEDDFILEQKKVKLFTSSAKKNTLLQKGIKDILSSSGYELS